jgi:hypothetical protein
MTPQITEGIAVFFRIGPDLSQLIAAFTPIPAIFWFASDQLNKNLVN